MVGTVVVMMMVLWRGLFCGLRAGSTPGGIGGSKALCFFQQVMLAISVWPSCVQAILTDRGEKQFA